MDKMTASEVKKFIDEDYKEDEEICPKDIYVFANGNVAVFDGKKNKQIAFLQGLLSGCRIHLQPRK